MRRYYAVPRFLYDFFTHRRNAWISASKLSAIQEGKLRAMVRYAYRYVPFYHKLLDCYHIKPNEIKTVADLQKLPIITKEDVRVNLKSMISRKENVHRCVKSKTSGSTGFPLTIFTDMHAQNFRSAVALRQFFECGGRVRDKQVQIRGAGASSLANVQGKPFYEFLGLFRTEWFAIGARIPDSLISFLRSYQPDVMMGYPSFFQIIAEKDGGEINSRVVFCTSEILTDDCRDLVESSFETRIIDSYGCTEGGDVAWECPEGQMGYHVNCDAAIVEFVKDGERVDSGEEGEIVLTNLFNHAMPFIRYRIGDVGVPSDEKCSCGRTLPLMKLLVGRADDFIVFPDGEKISPQSIITECAKNVTEVLQYRLIQERRDLIVVLLKMRPGFVEESVKRFIAAIQVVLGEEIEVRAQVVDEIPRAKAGKLNRIVSRVGA